MRVGGRVGGRVGRWELQARGRFVVASKNERISISPERRAACPAEAAGHQASAVAEPLLEAHPLAAGWT